MPHFSKGLNQDSLIKITKSANYNDSSRYNSFIQLSKQHLYSQSDSSYYYASKAFLYAKKMHSRLKQGYVFALIGGYYQLKESYSKSIENYFEALRLSDITEDSELKIIALSSIAGIYSSTDKPEIALKYLLKCLKIVQKANNQKYLAPLYANLSDVYIKLNNYEMALKYGQQASNLLLSKNNPNIYVAYDNIGIAYMKQHKLNDALVYFNKALVSLKNQKNIYAIIDVNLNLATLYEMKNQVDSALHYAKYAEILSLEYKFKDGQVKSNFELYKLYKKTGNAVKALDYHEQYLDFVKQQHKDEQAAQIEKNVFIYNTTKKIHADSLKQQVINLQKDQKIKTHQAQIKQDKLFKIGLFLLIVLAIGIGVFAFNRYKIISYQHRLIEIKNNQSEAQKEIIVQKNNEVKDSLNYAKRIQEGLLASHKSLSANLKNHFIVFKPKDIVSGDFYWSTEYQNNFYLAVCDSTGHGVPGAFMSLLNIALLSEAIKEKQIKEPNLIFNEARERLIEIISADGHKDGFDGILIRIEKQIDGGITLQYAAANNELLLVRNNAIIKLSADRMPVSKSDFTKSFTLHAIDIEKDDMLYLYTDGFADQFGGVEQKKFKRKHLNELLAKNASLEMDKQSKLLNDDFELWKGADEQVDDVCIVGIKF